MDWGFECIGETEIPNGTRGLIVTCPRVLSKHLYVAYRGDVDEGEDDFLRAHFGMAIIVLGWSQKENRAVMRT